MLTIPKQIAQQSVISRMSPRKRDEVVDKFISGIQFCMMVPRSCLPDRLKGRKVQRVAKESNKSADSILSSSEKAHPSITLSSNAVVINKRTRFGKTFSNSFAAQITSKNTIQRPVITFLTTSSIAKKIIGSETFNDFKMLKQRPSQYSSKNVPAHY